MTTASITDTRPAVTVAEHQAAADAQQMLVDRLRVLLAAEEHQLAVLRRRVAQLGGDWTLPPIPAQRTQGHEQPQGGAR